MFPFCFPGLNVFFSFLFFIHLVFFVLLPVLLKLSILVFQYSFLHQVTYHFLFSETFSCSLNYYSLGFRLFCLLFFVCLFICFLDSYHLRLPFAIIPRISFLLSWSPRSLDLRPSLWAYSFALWSTLFSSFVKSNIWYNLEGLVV